MRWQTVTSPLPLDEGQDGAGPNQARGELALGLSLQLLCSPSLQGERWWLLNNRNLQQMQISCLFALAQLANTFSMSLTSLYPFHVHEE